MTTMTVTEVLATIRSCSPEERATIKRELLALESSDGSDEFIPTAEQQADVDRALEASAKGDTVGIEEIRSTLYR